MTEGKLFIDGQWRTGAGPSLTSLNPASGAAIWSGPTAAASDVELAMRAARMAFEDWSACSFDERVTITRRYAELLGENQERLADIIGQETGKPLWESRTEVAAMIGKIDISVRAWQQRSGVSETHSGSIRQVLQHRPHGVVAVFGPYNFPGHLPNGHIVPALLAGNAVLFKPSEQTPMVAEETLRLWQQAGVPPGVINLLQGERATGEAIANHADLDGLFFTGSSRTGHLLNRQFADRPGKILALEMGGNNPLVIGDLGNLKAAIYDTIQSAYLSAGQRCTCARRLLVPRGDAGDAFVAGLIEAAGKLRIGRYDEAEQPFMGCVISGAAADQLLTAQRQLLDRGAVALLAMQKLAAGPAFVSPALLDVTEVAELPDEEDFGPLLKLIRYDNFEQALAIANDTRYGLSASLLSDRPEHWALFQRRIRAGIVNWNRQTTGASSAAPFGGIGASGNHRPSAFYAADYCAYPVASLLATTCELPAQLSPGVLL